MIVGLQVRSSPNSNLGTVQYYFLKVVSVLIPVIINSINRTFISSKFTFNSLIVYSLLMLLNIDNDIPMIYACIIKPLGSKKIIYKINHFQCHFSKKEQNNPTHHLLFFPNYFHYTSFPFAFVTIHIFFKP